MSIKKFLSRIKAIVTYLVSEPRKFVMECKKRVANPFELFSKDEYLRMLSLAGSPKGFPTHQKLLLARQTHFHLPLTMRDLCIIAEKKLNELNWT